VGERRIGVKRYKIVSVDPLLYVYCRKTLKNRSVDPFEPIFGIFLPTFGVFRNICRFSDIFDDFFTL
jgi:hypothetical protein